ncbi:hypothetical protein QE152_g10191 [Popillia japonica]|uniref:Uncharacterized protein n=1 Tax=Popillia japonica TaxID=7064 RepID=A0AAW1LVK7_POPJA
MVVDSPECSRTTTKGGRVSPGTRPPQQQRAPVKAPPRTAEALAILIQHLVFNNISVVLTISRKIRSRMQSWTGVSILFFYNQPTNPKSER